eukprot:CAMPEP_0170491508 /NCGR_PEP_ID=MMETSP0208-20121228/11088_1 /TAXON_ID=197538 /ORGANISM="Strombidium inclinatum, Strain S3" /LENGTH=152 /DNA_ID=CAMNT_0010767091 /DNA_START=2928 /DNA_END=3385 /DNA_ORIENTATION=+
MTACILEHWPVLSAAGEELLALDGAGHYITDERILLGEIRREVHFLPFKFLAEAHSGEAEVRADGFALHEVKEAVLGVHVNGRRVLLLLVLLDVEHLAVPVLVLKDMRVLLPLQPRILEVEQQGLAPVLQQAFHLIAARGVAGVDVRRGRAF